MNLRTPQERVAALKAGYVDKDIEWLYIAKNNLSMMSCNLLFSFMEST